MKTQKYPRTVFRVLRTEIADEQPPAKLARTRQVGNHQANEPGRLPQGRLRCIHGGRILGHLNSGRPGSWVCTHRFSPVLFCGHNRQDTTARACPRHDITWLSMMGLAPSAASLVCYPRNQERCTGCPDADTAAG